MAIDKAWTVVGDPRGTTNCPLEHDGNGRFQLGKKEKGHQLGHQTEKHIPAPSNRSPLKAFVDLKVAGGDLLEGPGSKTLGKAQGSDLCKAHRLH